jgi:activating signal cointegrator 1
MKAISLWQPWAYALVSGMKKIETRSWSTPYRGPLLIHAAKTFPVTARDFAMTERALGRLPARLPFGALVGVVNLADVRRTESVIQEISAIERLYGDYSWGRYAWMTDSFMAFDEPVPYKGKQGFFNVPDEIIKGGYKWVGLSKRQTSLCNVLLCCPDCNSPASESLVIHTSKRREPNDKNHAFAECKKCGYSIELSTGGDVTLIRKLWNIR